jgi:hypothetical protein
LIILQPPHVQCLLLKFFVCVCVCGAKASANWCKLFNRRPSREKRFAKGCNGATVGSLLKGPLCQAKINASARKITKKIKVLEKDFKKRTSIKGLQEKNFKKRTSRKGLPEKDFQKRTSRKALPLVGPAVRILSTRNDPFRRAIASNLAFRANATGIVPGQVVVYPPGASDARCTHQRSLLSEESLCTPR